ncbi:MAG: RibD family protein [Lachnospiraceae bacterium]|nr:RibD family protein [Lachnospiraceae bacterium]
MKRPYVICHILSSLDGKINGPFMGTESVSMLGAEYGKFRTKMAADAWMYGTTTTKEFINFRKPVLAEECEVPQGDFIADNQAELYYISLDVDGEIGWESGIFSNKGRTPAHVIEVLTESTPTAYKDYLRKRGVSYIIAGEKNLDCKLAMEKLYEYFQIEKVLICGGGVINWSFLQAGMIDELNLFLAPVSDGSSGKASVFTQIPSLSEGKPVEFLLKDMEKIGDGGLRLNYLVKNVEQK